MIGLVLKDLINLKKQLKIFIFMLVFYFIFSMTTKNGSMFGTMVTLLFAMQPITALAFDEKANWDKYALAMPVSRAEIVISKYVLGILLSLFAALLNFIAQFLLGTEINVDNIIAVFVIFSVSIIFFSLLLPVIFKFGVEKGRLLMFIVLMLPTLIILIFKDTFSSITQDMIIKAIYGLPLLAIAILILSMLLSISIYKKKEF